MKLLFLVFIKVCVCLILHLPVALNIWYSLLSAAELRDKITNQPSTYGFYQFSNTMESTLYAHPTSFTPQKTVFAFPKWSEKMVFSPKKLRWNRIFFVLSRKLAFLFPKNIILFFSQKMKDNLSQKNAWKYDNLCKSSGKMVFSKTVALEYDLFCIIRKDDTFSLKIWSYTLDGKRRTIFPKKQKQKQKRTKKTCKYDISCKCSGKLVFPENLHLSMIFLVFSEKVLFLFDENIMLSFRQKMKDHISQKKYMEILFFIEALPRS